MGIVPSVALPAPERGLGDMVRLEGSADTEIEFDDGIRIANFDEPVAALTYERNGEPVPLEVIVHRHGLEQADVDTHAISFRQLLMDWLHNDEPKFAMSVADDLERVAVELREWAKTQA